MATLDWHVTGERGVTLVSLLVTSDATERVRVTNRLDGPVWPPRREGVPAEGWTDDGFEGVVGTNERLILGYASPADPQEPPATVTTFGPEQRGDSAVSPRDVVRALGDPNPPRDAVPSPDRTSEDASDPAPDTTLEDWEWGRTADSNSQDTIQRPDKSGDHPRMAVEDWLGEVTHRLEAAERLADATSVRQAREAVAAVGDPGDVAELRAQLDEDRETLQRVVDRSETLASRVDALDLPVETLERLA